MVGLQVPLILDTSLSPSLAHGKDCVLHLSWLAWGNYWQLNSLCTWVYHCDEDLVFMTKAVRFFVWTEKFYVLSSEFMPWRMAFGTCWKYYSWMKGLVVWNSLVRQRALQVDVVPGQQSRWAGWLKDSRPSGMTDSSCIWDGRRASDVRECLLRSMKSHGLILYQNHECNFCSVCRLHMWMIEVGWICSKSLG